MQNYIIDKDTMLKAVTYMPITEKQSIAKIIANKCVIDLPTAEQNIEGEKFLALPYIKGEDKEIKDMCLLSTLLQHYLKVEIKDNEVFDEEKFDYYASGAILNQIERFKSDFTCKDKAFDLLSDYKELRKMVDAEIENLLRVNNDTLARFMAAIQVFSTPENVEKMVKELQKLQPPKIKTASTTKKKERPEKTAENKE